MPSNPGYQWRKGLQRQPNATILRCHSLWMSLFQGLQWCNSHVKPPFKSLLQCKRLNEAPFPSPRWCTWFKKLLHPSLLLCHSQWISLDPSLPRIHSPGKPTDSLLRRCPGWRWVARGGNLDTAVACLLDFIKFFCTANYYKVLQGSDEDCLWLDEWNFDRVVVDRQLRNTLSVSGPAATMDDVYVLFGVLLCNVNGTDFNQEWFQNRLNDLVALFPAVSEPPPILLYSESQADALAAFGEQWPYTAAHIVCTIVEGRFKGPMQQLQQYVSEFWSFAGMEYAEFILEFLIIPYPWVVDVIPELKSKDSVLKEFLHVYKCLDADAPYMQLLQLLEAAKALREPLRLHAAAAYALDIVEDWSQYTGVPNDRAEEEVFEKVSTMVQLGLRAPPVKAHASRVGVTTIPLDSVDDPRTAPWSQ
ncbi:hypothetical protein HPB52_024419 [Rhipicephalus sanguineus]|uniref:Uncharacterized protein n=1 Tax=Rhipicephalus sanguineus TaxID=34632 RepID=A0A9D4TCC4_RHISA|nr:hypothetical protein HPB52_024419 [Rhipicephalus sanguineus]